MNCDDIINHIKDFSCSLYSRDEWYRPLLDNLDFACIGEESAQWMEREFEEEEICKAVFDLGREKAPGPDGFPVAFFQIFWADTKEDILAFM